MSKTHQMARKESLTKDMVKKGGTVKRNGKRKPLNTRANSSILSRKLKYFLDIRLLL